MKIAFVDTLGLCYDGSTLEKRGLGGSESAVIRMAQELQKIGFDVTVFNDCTSDDSNPGRYDGVNYCPLEEAKTGASFDVVIVSRSVKPYLENWKVCVTARHKVLWMHDTFCEGDNDIENLILEGRINEIFTLSDWHTSYVTNADHGRRRNFDILKNHIFQTRNGIGNMNPGWINIRDKDPNLFVFNASVTKGMVPLVKDIWPRVKERIPAAKLTIIGGYYKFREAAGPDQQEKDWTELALQHGKDINFTGVIRQQEISDILRKASYMIYPAGFPETYGISTLEALAHNVPLITCRFGALEETAIDIASYKIPYPVEPNWALPWLNKDHQVDVFVEAVCQAYANTYLHQQKMYACNQVKDICTWDTVALQWKQHLYKNLGEFLPVNEYKKVQKINNQVRKVFGRRFMNAEELVEPQQAPFWPITIVTPVYNAENYIKRCIESVAQQDYPNYVMHIIDDNSTDRTLDVAYETIDALPEEVQHRFWVKSNRDNLGAVWNQVSTIEKECGDDIVMLLDGDDWLVNDPTLFHKYNNLYNEGAEFTYGSCWSIADNIPLIAQEYPPEVKADKSYRFYKFNWNMPYTHLRTFRAQLMHDYLRDNGNYAFRDPMTLDWLKAGGDTAVFYTMIEAADPDKVVCVTDIVYNYNDANPLNDYKVNGDEQNATAKQVLERPESAVKKKILIAIPSKNDICAETFKSIYDLEVPEGYETEFQYFYGYQVDQVRNLIADWAMNYDYLFAVDHDMTFPPDTLKKLLSHDKDIVSGLYRQRLPTQTIEIFDFNYRHIPIEQLVNRGLIEVGGCGFGCVLVKSEVFMKMQYPHFLYQSALDHRDTKSEDTYFCKKARGLGFTVWADTSIMCGHIGQTTWAIELPPVIHIENLIEARLRDLASRDDQPRDHVDYLKNMKVKPKVVYDIGACVMHWTKEARKIWPEAEIVMFDAMDHAQFLYKESGLPYWCGCPLSDVTKEVEFYENAMDPAGNSYYKENTPFFTDQHKVKKVARPLDELIVEMEIPLPDLVKIDVQGAELDVLRGATKTLEKCKDIIIEMQHEEYNLGAPKVAEVTEYLNSIGFKLVDRMHAGGVDGDYHFTRV